MSAPNRPPEHVLEFIKEHFEYEPESGELLRFNLHTQDWQLVSYTLEADLIQCNKIKISVDGKIYEIRPHNICWFLMTGEWPGKTIDHIDRDACNNKWNNLRLANHSLQAINQSSRSRNFLVGARYNKSSSTSTFFSQIERNNKPIYLGCFYTELDAHIAYCNAYREIYGEELPLPYRQAPWTENNLDFCEPIKEIANAISAWEGLK